MLTLSNVKGIGKERKEEEMSEVSVCSISFIDNKSESVVA
jgi:hypothetical protein